MQREKGEDRHTGQIEWKNIVRMDAWHKLNKIGIESRAALVLRYRYIQSEYAGGTGRILCTQILYHIHLQNAMVFRKKIIFFWAAHRPAGGIENRPAKV